MTAYEIADLITFASCVLMLVAAIIDELKPPSR